MTDISELAELIQMELLHGCDPDTLVTTKYRHVAACVLSWLLARGWGEIEEGGVLLTQEQAATIALTLTGVIHGTASALSAIALCARDEAES